jgi:predicted RNA binding protein YcfA (HicA-like mRNA interferase family)
LTLKKVCILYTLKEGATLPKRPKTKDIIKRLKSEGYVQKATEGSHKHFVHPDFPGKITVVVSKAEQSIGVLREIYRQAKWKWPPE